jgi:hypothetical protein
MGAWHVEDLLVGMRSQAEQPGEAIDAFVRGVVSGDVSRPQAAASLGGSRTPRRWR